MDLSRYLVSDGNVAGYLNTLDYFQLHVEKSLFQEYVTAFENMDCEKFLQWLQLYFYDVAMHPWAVLMDMGCSPGVIPNTAFVIAYKRNMEFEVAEDVVLPESMLNTYVSDMPEDEALLKSNALAYLTAVRPDYTAVPWESHDIVLEGMRFMQGVGRRLHSAYIVC